MGRVWCPCGKRIFTSRGNAERAIVTIRTKGEKRAKTPKRAYPCPHRPYWHLTSKD